MIARMLQRAAHRLPAAFRTRPAADSPLARDERKRERAAQRERVRAARRAAEAERRRQRREAADCAREALLVRDRAAVRAHELYLQLRPWAERLEQEGRAVPLTVSERRMLDALAPVWQSTPETIATLRQWCDPASTAPTSEYDDGSSQLGKRLRRDLKRVFAEVGRDLFVSEPALLGGYGFETQGQRYNADTLRFFNALVALLDGGVLNAFRGSTARRLVWEIGGGWGGFAYQFKSICPNTTYVISGAPAFLLVAAIYVMTVFPDARCRREGDALGDLWSDWEDTDFVFVSEAALPALRPPRVDLAIDIAALENMTAPRIESHVQWAYDRGCRYFYSLKPGDFAYDAMPAAWTAIGARYWLHPVPPRLEVDKVVAIDYSHLVGWARLRV